ncbi:ABC transporter permease [Methanobacterium sp.]|uniref:ABC transporter permease n=1 Tax=Methanobacterium sp. TaxID=2164 RepID=UPI0025F503A7|nr:ABC transporter permease [Methanobacterium sp.]MBI5460226.1 ABC transporter permease [Methanobacterium sp.]
MSELRGISALWRRELIRFIRDRSRLISSVITPILWLVIFGGGLGLSISAATGLNYTQFLLPGIIAQTLLFTAIFLGISVIWDRQFGFMKEILVAPISRVSIFAGKMFGVGTAAIIQGIIVIILGYLIGVPLSLYAVSMAVPLMIIITIGLTCIGLVIASLMTSLESFGTIVTFVNMPMFFLSGALFPVTNLPAWIRWTFYINPLTYGVDALRGVMISGWQTLLPLEYDILIICAFDVVMVVIGTYLFSKRQ